MPRSSRRRAVLPGRQVALKGDTTATGVSDAPRPASGDNGRMDARRPMLGAVLGLLAVVELAARLTAGSTVRAGLAAGPISHTGVSAPTALLMGALVLACTVPAALLRPVPAAVAAGLAAVVSLALFELVTAAGAAALLFAAYRLARGGSRWAVLVLAAPFLAIAVAVTALGPAATPVRGLLGAHGDAQVLAVLLSSGIPIAALAGMAGRAREESRGHSAARELTEGVLAEHLARGERARIARELHDVVAHHISMIAVQAETARLTTPGLTGDGAARFAAIGDTARAGLTEMRRLLGVLREDSRAADDAPEAAVPDAARPADRRPQPGLAELADLVDVARQASGSAARLIVSGPVTRLDPGVELAAYRIVQEALTNARRHAPGAAVDVELRYADGLLRLRVRDNGPGAAGHAAGHGLAGMRERAAAAGGAMRAGNASGGGFRIEADLPAKAPDAMTGTA